MLRFFNRFFHRLFFTFGLILNANLDPCWPPWGHLGASWRRLGELLGRLGSLLGPLGGQDPPEARGLRVLRASWDRLGLIFERFLDDFFKECSLLFLSYLTRRQHVVKPQNSFICSTKEPSEALRGHYF